jgi:hypothetical protein
MVLWDLSQEAELWTLGNWGWPIGFSRVSWLSDGMGFIAITRSVEEEFNNYPELIQVSTNGQVSQLTNIHDLGLETVETEHGFYNLMNPVLSPNTFAKK